MLLPSIKAGGKNAQMPLINISFAAYVQKKRGEWELSVPKEGWQTLMTQ